MDWFNILMMVLSALMILVSIGVVTINAGDDGFNYTGRLLWSICACIWTASLTLRILLYVGALV